jgi:outer membrane protein assembly factor BamB
MFINNRKPMKYKSTFSLLVCSGLLLISLVASSQDKNWTHFRGTRMNGLAEAEKIPLDLNGSVKWKTEIHDRGHSSPVIYKDQIWLTTATPDGKDLYAVCVDFKTGKIIHDIKVFSPATVDRKNKVNTYATPTPCIEKGFVYVHYGHMGTACINTSTGAVVWRNTDFTFKNVHGPASSPVLYKNLVILHFEGAESRYIVALDKATGKLKWRTDRPLEPYEPLDPVGKLSYITPLIINVKGQDLLISNGSAICQAFDPNTGKEVWRIVDGAETTVAMPFTEKGILYWYTGFNVDKDGKKITDLLAVNPDGKGDIAKTNILWCKKDESLSNQMLTPVIKNGLIWTATTMNNMMCIDASNGKELWNNRMTSAWNASPLYINGNVWFFSIKGEVLVLKAARDYQEVSKQQMDSGIWATPAVLRNSMIMRTEKYLYRISAE